MKTRKRSICCNSPVYSIFTWPHTLERLKREYGLSSPADIPPFKDVTLCDNCHRPAKVKEIINE